MPARDAEMRVLAVTNMYPNPREPALGTFVRDQVESLRDLGVDMDVLFIDGKASRWEYLAGFGRLRWWLRTHPPYDLIHAHYIFSGLVAKSQRRLPVLLTHHGIEVVLGWQGTLCRVATPWMDRVIVTSEAVRNALPRVRTDLVPCGIDTERFRPMDRGEARARLGLPAEGGLVLFAGEPRPEKRLDVIRAAMDELRRLGTDAELVTAAGRPHADVPLFMNACDVLVLASDFEGSPMVIKEAMACNLPIVSVDVGDVAQVVRGTEGCALCRREPGDVADKLQRALRRGGRTDGRGAVMHLSQPEIARRILGIYGEMVEGRR